MLKILTSKQIKEADAFTIANEPIASIDLMERAATACFDWLCKKIPDLNSTFIVLCGVGNNGGDGLAIARLLLSKGYSVKTILVGDSGRMSANCKINYERLTGLQNASITNYSSQLDLPETNQNTILIDALFGTGLAKPVEYPYSEIIAWINQTAATVISIDVPSGMFAEPTHLTPSNVVVNATYTLSFQFPKLNFLLPDFGNSAGELVLLEIGLHPDFIAQVKTDTYFTEAIDIHIFLHKRPPFSHKGNYGHALLVAGSEFKMGAAILSTHACLRSGCGLVTAFAPKSGRPLIQVSLPEAMLLENEDESISPNLDLSPYSAIGMGPGMGTNDAAAKSLKLVIQNALVPLVLDADAITILANNKTWLGFFRDTVVFTPHVKEFERLTQKADNAAQRLELAKDFCIKNRCYLVLKGKYSAVVCPDGNLYFNSTGNPGMAKGGSGDVLTGILTGLLAQGYHPKIACIIGVYLHGLAGDLAAKKLSQSGLLASDIISMLPEAFLSFEEQ